MTATIERETLGSLISDVEDAAMEYQESKTWAGGRYDNGAEARRLEEAKAALAKYVLGED